MRLLQYAVMKTWNSSRIACYSKVEEKAFIIQKSIYEWKVLVV